MNGAVTEGMRFCLLLRCDKKIGSLSLEVTGVCIVKKCRAENIHTTVYTILKLFKSRLELELEL